MKTALLSDIHANIQALEACLAHAQAQGAQRYAVLGDHVGYGANPREVLERIMALATNGALVLQGNHDLMAITPPTEVKEHGQQAAAWTSAQLTSTHKDFLAQLPLSGHMEQCWLVHASVDAPAQWRYIHDERSAAASLDAACAQDSAVRYVFGGHVHHQTLYYKGGAQKLMAFAPTPGVPIPMPAHRYWIATVGSVGQPRDGQQLAMYAMFDHQSARLTFYRVPYDVAAAMSAIRQAGLPEHYAQRLEEGR